jgi:tetratricopeptide (TPR) repeat protein
MMKKFVLVLFSVVFAATGFAQPENPQETALKFMNSGDWDNAILVLNTAIKQDPQNLELHKYLVLSYTYKRDFARALEVIKPLIDRDDIDEQMYQASGNVYRALAMKKEGERMYKKALKKFPSSGPLYSEYGEMLWDIKDYDAIQLWEKGIEADPAYPGNYYNAASYYYFTKDKVWTLLYGEIFVNMENLTERATEVKNMLLSTYKEKLFADLGKEKEKDKNAFTEAVLQTYNRQTSVLTQGITLETLTKLRTRFILDWYNNYSKKFPFKLFDHQQQLIREGMFEAYNQWLFTTPENLAAFDQWTKANAEAYKKFTAFQKNRVFKMPPGQHYHEIKKS